MSNKLIDNINNLYTLTDARIFEPSLNIFKNGIVFNYKKVGSRFLREMSSGGNDKIFTDNKQIELFIQNNQIENTNIKLNNTINYQFTEKYVVAPWHIFNIHKSNNIEDQRITQLANSYTEWKDDNSFLRSVGKSSYSELFFENEKDIIFLIRDPLDRFTSGLTQIMHMFMDIIQTSPHELLFFRNNSEITELNIDTLAKIYKTHFYQPIDLIKHVPEHVIIKIFKYILRYKWELIFQDIHIEPYLSHFRELIYNIKDTSKIKVIDLSHLKTRKSMEFFCDLRGDNIPVEIYNNIESHIESNKLIYRIIQNAIMDNEANFDTFEHVYNPISYYLRNEIHNYTNLITSPYFINLED